MSIGKIIVLAIGIFIAASLLPDAIELIETANHTWTNGTGVTFYNWNTATIALWGIISLVCIVTLVYYLLPNAWRGGK